MASNVVSLLSSDEDEQNLDDTMVVSIPTPCLSNKTAQKRSALEAAKVASTTSAVMAGNTAISKHVSACIQSPKWGQRFSSTIHDPFLVSSLPTTTTTTKITATNISWEDLRLKLTDSDFIVLSAHALKKYEEMKFTSIPSPRKKSKVANKSTEKGNIYDRLENLVDAIHALARRTVSSSIKESVKPIPSSNNTNTPSYWKSGTGYGGGNTKGANDMKQAFTLQTKAHQRQATEDSSSKLLLDKALQQLKGCENDLLLHPVTSGAILRYFVPQCANYLSTSFDDICEREHLFTSVLSIISFFKKNPYYQHILHVPPDETSGKNKLEEEDNSPPPPSIEQLLSTLNRQASMFAVTLGSNKQSKEAKACMRLTTSIQACIGSSSSSSGNGNGRRRGGRDANNKNNKQSLADVVGSNGGPSSMSVDPVDLTSRSGQQIDSYVAVMNTMKIKTEKLLNGSKFSYHYRAQAQNVKSSQPKRLIRIGKELASLSNSLPIHDTSSVFVCIDEERPDCLKALIVGPAGTPYENGLFEFDIFLPSNYPNVPPKVILVTTGGGQIRFNPNLYAEGKVCLSLLGTWAGPGWHPNCTLLQVLISIQSLILVDEPFFNEPGFEKYQGTEAGVS
jgi:ubiquitin-protein ligase